MLDRCCRKALLFELKELRISWLICHLDVCAQGRREASTAKIMNWVYLHAFIQTELGGLMVHWVLNNNWTPTLRPLLSQMAWQERSWQPAWLRDSREPLTTV